MKPALRLVETAEVVQLPVRSTFEDAWACRAGQMRKRGDGRDKTRKLWDRASKKVGSARLLEALKRYLREEKEPQCGYPGLSVWLNAERYDHWLESTGPSEGQPQALVVRAPEPLRSSAILALGEPFVRSYLDPATFHDDGYITPRTGFAKEKLVEKASVLKACGVVGIRPKE